MPNLKPFVCLARWSSWRACRWWLPPRRPSRPPPSPAHPAGRHEARSRSAPADGLTAHPAEPRNAPRTTDKSVTAPGKVNPLVGLAVFSSDGSKIGTVQSVSAAPDGSAKAIHIKTGGFLGFGGKLVAIPEGRFTKSGDAIQLGMTAEEVGKLPEVKEQS